MAHVLGSEVLQVSNVIRAKEKESQQQRAGHGGWSVLNVQETQAEDCHEKIFLLLAQLQLVQHRQGHNENGEVGGDVPSCVDVPKRQVGHACSG